MRRTGRTTRMLNLARRLSSEKRAVYVIVANKKIADEFQKKFDKFMPHTIKFETFFSLNNFDIETMELRGAHENCVVLVDHFAIESRFSKMLEELYRYNL